MSVVVRLLGTEDAGVLDRVAEDVFDEAVVASLTREFLDDPRHHLAVAIDGDRVVGIASALDYVHPDKPRQLWINEVGVAPPWQRRGLASAMIEALLAHAKRLGCVEAWVGTEPDNTAARGLYEALGGQIEPAVIFAWALEPDAGDQSGRN